MIVSVIIPVVRRDKIKNCIRSIVDQCGLGIDAYEIIWAIDDEGIGCPKMVKCLTRKAKADMVCFMGDDTLGANDFLLKAVREMENFPGGWGVVGINDGTYRELPTHWLAHKKMLPHLDGEFFHTGYTHCYCDNELRDRARAMGRYKMCKEALIIHNHPDLGAGEMDAYYEKVYSKETMAHDKRLYEYRKKTGYKTR